MIFFCPTIFYKTKRMFHLYQCNKKIIDNPDFSKATIASVMNCEIKFFEINFLHTAFLNTLTTNYEIIPQVAFFFKMLTTSYFVFSVL